jgi:hypothetical protein
MHSGILDGIRWAIRYVSVGAFHRALDTTEVTVQRLRRRIIREVSLLKAKQAM